MAVFYRMCWDRKYGLLGWAIGILSFMMLLGWYYRESNEAPEWWRATIPNEIRRRDKNEPNVWDRTPGKYLR